MKFDLEQTKVVSAMEARRLSKRDLMRRGLSRHAVDAIEGKHPIALDRLVHLGRILQSNALGLVTEESRQRAYSEFPLAIEETSYDASPTKDVLVPFYGPKEIQSGLALLGELRKGPPFSSAFETEGRRAREMRFIEDCNAYVDGALAPQTVWMNCHSDSYLLEWSKQLGSLESALKEVGSTRKIRSGALHVLVSSAESEVEAAEKLNAMWGEHHRVFAIDVARPCVFERVATEYIHEDNVGVVDLASYMYGLEPIISTRFMVLAPSNSGAVIVRHESKPLVQQNISGQAFASALESGIDSARFSDLLYAYKRMSERARTDEDFV